MTTPQRCFVWLGGALFVGSLAEAVYTYVIRWNSPIGGPPGSALAVDSALFTFFALHHSLFAREGVKARIAHVVPEPLLRSTYVWIASVLFFATLIFWQPVGGDLYRQDGVEAVVLTAIQILGIWIIGRAVATIDPLELAGIRRLDRQEALQITGPYRFVRHPLYLGWMLAVFGAAHMTGDRLAFAVLSSAYLVVAIPWEERSLLRSFGDEYARYQRQVRWRVVPFVY